MKVSMYCAIMFAIFIAPSLSTRFREALAAIHLVGIFVGLALPALTRLLAP